MRHVFSVATVLCAAAGCYTGSTESANGPGNMSVVGPQFTLRGKLIDKDTKAPLNDSLVVVEVGGRYLSNPDTSKGHPDYRFVAKTNGEGVYEVRDVPAGFVAGRASPKWGVHTFQNNYRYGTDLVELQPDGTPRVLEVTVSPNLAEDVKPRADDLKVEPPTVAPGGKLVFTANVKASGNVLADGGIEGDALSEEVLLAEVTTQWARAMDPPSRGKQGVGYPNGIWRHEGSAPTKPGKYTFYLVSSSERCITSDRISVEVTVDESLTATGPQAAACNSVPSLDKQLVLEQVPAAPPAPLGGPIADGTYVLTGYRRYTGAGGASGLKADTTFHETAVYAGSVLQVNFGDSNYNVQQTYRHETNATTFAHTVTCGGAPQVFTGSYTASGSALSYFEADSTGTNEFAFTRSR